MNGRKKATLRDIASRTGYSVNTVSVALRSGKKVRPDTRNRILEVARELDYLPNALARSLARKSSGTVGLLISNLQNPILTLSAEHVEQQLEAQGYQTLLRSTNGDLDRERRAVESLRELQVEGILVYPADHRQIGHLTALRRAGLPVIFLAGPPDPAIDLVAIDDHASCLAITGPLIGLGLRRIGLLDVSLAHGAYGKLTGFLAAHEEAGITVDPRLVYCPIDRNRASVGYRRAARLLQADPPPTAVVCASDVLAIGLLSWCRDNGISVPDRLSVAGLDNIEASAHLAVPLSTVRYSVEEISQTAVSRLVGQMRAEGHLPDPAHIMIPPELIVRRSTRPPGGGDDFATNSNRKT
jgi:DNA-binding LacI/PurR family transcriptional regulator